MRNTAGTCEFENERPCGITFLKPVSIPLLYVEAVWLEVKDSSTQISDCAGWESVYQLGDLVRHFTFLSLSFSGRVYFLIMKYQRKIHMLLLYLITPPAVKMKPLRQVLGSGIGNFQIWPLKSALRPSAYFLLFCRARIGENIDL